jgi:hypothetical protein
MGLAAPTQRDVHDLVDSRMGLQGCSGSHTRMEDGPRLAQAE